MDTAKKRDILERMESLRREIETEEGIQFSIREKAKELIGAGNATFSIANPQHEHFTFRINCVQATDRDSRQPQVDANGDPVYVWFAGVLTGPDNATDYNYLAVFEPTTWKLRWTSGSKIKEDAPSSRVLKYFLNLIFDENPLPEGYDIWHAGRCCRCGRKLTVPASIAAGIGPVCATSMGW